MEFAGLLIDIIGLIAVIVAVKALRLNSHQFRFDVMTSCIARFQELIPDLVGDSEVAGSIAERVKRKYVDLCNEELFYFKNDFVPHEVMHEWLDGMLHFIPLKYKDEILNKPVLAATDVEKYRRIVNAFKIDVRYGLDDQSERRQAREAILANCRTYRF